MKQPVLLGIFAHPDDESFGPGGTLARYAAEGAAVHVCTLTDGAAGTADPDCWDCLEGYEDLAQRRLEELRCAVQILGGHLHFMGYRDSGMAGNPANDHPDALINRPLEDVTRRLTRLIRELQPDAVITHDDTGNYFHPDHIYTYVMPRTYIRYFVWLTRLSGQDPTRFGRNQDIDLTRVGKPSDQIHVRLRVQAYLTVKQQAGACHGSQGGGGGLSTRVGPTLRDRITFWLRRWFVNWESFQQLYPQPVGRRSDLIP
jgi:mycothiol S-conjugate amidase